MGKPSDEKTKKMLRTSIKNVVRNISYLSNSVSLKNNTNKGPISLSDLKLAELASDWLTNQSSKSLKSVQSRATQSNKFYNRILEK